ncbi:hypothetical protein ABT075_21960 [Streptomyces sp. NPDC002677]|uniref:hypothetical protein n=1 Tax=Streptomyces sp. NPDC002677 TaxID=3154774 RepID=UPI00331F5466
MIDTGAVGVSPARTPARVNTTPPPSPGREESLRQRLPDTEPKLRELLTKPQATHETVLIVADSPASTAAPPPAAATDTDCPVAHPTGIRIEELSDLSHHGLVPYRLPTPDQLIPLPRIAPSKTDTERLLAVSPELADVPSTNIRRVHDGNGRVPLVPPYDPHEHTCRVPPPDSIDQFDTDAGIQPAEDADGALSRSSSGSAR